MTTIDAAFRKIKRLNFVPEDLRHHADVDAPLPIGFGQTISQPTTVRLMLEWLEAEPGDKVLDVGSGSGWTSALLSELVGPKGRVHAVELIPELLEFGRQNVTALGIKNVSFHQAKKGYGWARNAPYRRILVSASAQEVPKELIAQLEAGGEMVIPVKNDIVEISKNPKGDLSFRHHNGFVFVPLL